MSDLADIKKNLKKWENDFFNIHKKKPDKIAIEQAPLEIKDLYSKYSKLKKTPGSSTKQNGTHVDKAIDDNNMVVKGSEEVWGEEMNRSTADSFCKVDTTDKMEKGGGFLDKLSDRMFQNSKFMSAKKLKNFHKNVFSNPFSKEPSKSDEIKSEMGSSKYGNVQSLGCTKSSTVNNVPNKETFVFSDLDSDLVIKSFGALKNNLFSNVHSFKSSVHKVSRQSELTDIPQQFCIPVKPRFVMQTMEEAKLKADSLRSFMVTENEVTMELEDNADLKCDSPNDYKMKSRSVISDSSPRACKPPSNMFTTSPTSANNVVTPRPSFLKRKSVLQQNLEHRYVNSDPVNVVDPTKYSKVVDDFEFNSGSEGSPVKAKPQPRKRKATTSSTTNKASSKRQKTETATELPATHISVCDAEDSPPKKQPIRRAAPASKKGINDNFVRLNMKAKKYKRKGGQMTGGMYKRKQWKMKMQERSKSYGEKCFICDLPGHWSNNCPEKGKQKKNAVQNLKPVDENDFLSLKEAALLARGVKVNRIPKENDVSATSCSQQWEEEELGIETEIVRSHVEKPITPEAFEVFYNKDVIQSTDTPKEMKKVLQQFGFESFRPGQEMAMKRILCGLSTLVVLSTGEGKSLCYQLPSFVFAQKSPCLTLVVSPLVSLMEDQVTGLPPGVNGACLHSNMSKVQKENVFTAIAEGSVHFLLVSPEAVVGGAWSTYGSFPGPDKLPPIAFVCIDEAHCLSEWSHNFRPSYLRLCKILREVYGVECFLGLTATATQSTALDVAKHLGIENDADAIIRGSPVPKNLLLSVSRDADKDEALINLLQGDRFSSCESIIIYCTRREQANRVATYIRTCLQKPDESLAQKKQTKGKVTKKQPLWSAECYHAGLTAAQRKKVQKSFMSGKLRVVVATVAFGMGLDKSDVRAVIHYNMPKSFESYVQEIGRAGRDRQLSHCHLFLDPDGKDLNELRRHIHGNTVDRFTLRKLLQKVFKKCRCRDVYDQFQETLHENEDKDKSSTDRICRGHERALCIEDCVMSLDVREEGVYTLLCYLELHPQKWVDILSPVYATCQVKCYGGPSQLQAVSRKCPPLAVAIAKQKMKGEYFAKSSTIEFSVVEISDSMGWQSAPVKRELRQLQWTTSPSTGGPIKSGVMVEFNNLGFHFRSSGDLTDNELDDILDLLHDRVIKQESNELHQLHLLSEALRRVSFKSYWMCADDGDIQRSDKLKTYIEEFFDNDDTDLSIAEKSSEMPSASLLDQLLSDVRQFFNLYGLEHTLTGRSIARIFHGIGSPCFPVETWGRVRRFWRCNLHIDFNLCLNMASQELVKLR